MVRNLLSCGILLALAACEDPATPPQDPVPPAPATLDDPKEDDVRSLEAHLAAVAARLKEMSLRGTADYFPESYEGTAPLSDPPPSRRADSSIHGFRIETWSGEPRIRVTRDEIVASLRESLKRVATIEHVRMKVASGDWTGSRYEAEVKFVLDATLNSGGRLAVQERIAMAFERPATEWRIVGHARRSGRRVSSARPTFVDATAEMGLNIRMFPPLQLRDPIPFMTEPFAFLGGIAVGDVDGDGFPDVLVNRVGERRLFRNVEGRRFVEITEQAGVGSEALGAGALFFDYDNDGDLDLLALAYHLRNTPSMFLYRNDGTGRFEDVTQASGMIDTGVVFSATAADIEPDGDLDVYVTLYQMPVKGASVSFPRQMFDASDAPPNRLWINNGNGTFSERARRAGVADTGWSFAAAFGDFNDDGRPDLYVANDFGRNRFYENVGDGRFEDATSRSRVGDVGFGMGVAWGDFDGDGRLDLYISNMYSTAGNRILDREPPGLTREYLDQMRKAARGNTLLRNRGNGTFEDVTERAGVAPAGWAWDTHFFDYDNDGRLDLYVANGFVSGESTADL